ncbi:MAG: PAS domain S-box protein [Syntrophobacteraceae bacterium]|jgi:PAS domain S-box-containing protein
MQDEAKTKDQIITELKVLRQRVVEFEKDNGASTGPAELRRRAEKRPKARQTEAGRLKTNDSERLRHELEIHQIELEMQNHELRNGLVQIEESRTRYSDLYDFAPVGYFTLDEKGVVLEANLTIARQLGIERSRLVGNQLNAYIVLPDRNTFRSHLGSVLKDKTHQACEVRFMQDGGGDFHALLDTILVEDAVGERRVRTSVTDITERKRAENEVSAQRDTLAKIFESAPYIMMLVTKDGRVTNINHKGVAFAGTPKEELLGLLCGEVLNCLGSFGGLCCGKTAECPDCPVRTRVMQTFETGQSIYDAKGRMTVRKNSREFVIEVSISTALVKDKDGCQVLVTIADTSERAKQTREIEDLNRLYSVLSRVSQAVVRATSPAKFLEQACREVVEGGGFLLAWIGQVELTTNAVVPTAFWGEIGEYVRGLTVDADSRPEGPGPLGTCIREHRPVVHNDFLHDPQTLPWGDRAAPFGIASAAVFPIERAGRAWGALTIYSDEVDRFGGGDVRLLEEVAGDIEFALDNLDREFRRQQAEEALMESEKKFKSFAEQALAGIYILQDGVFKFVNAKFAQMFGYTVEECLSDMPFKNLVYSEDLATVEEQVRRRISGEAESVHYTFRGLKKNGQIFLVEVYGATSVYKGKPAGAGTILDITDRKQSEDELRVSLRFLEIVHEHTETAPLLREYVSEIKNYTGCDAVGIRVVDENSNIPYVAYQGFSRKFYEIENPVSLKTDECMCINVIRGDVDLNLPFFTAGGAFCVNATSRFLATFSEEEKGRTRNRCNAEGYETVGLFPFRSEGRILGLVHVADHRENMLPPNVVKVLEKAALQLGTAFQRALTERKLRESEERLALTADATHIGMFDWNVLKSEIVWTKQHEALFGYPSADSSMRSYKDWADRVHPADLPWVEGRIQQAMAEGTIYQAEYRIVLPDGNLRWIEGRGLCHYDADGRPVRLLGTVQDITERKRAEQEKEKLETQLRQSQKVEAIGMLAGGIAHDLNNILQPIIGYTEIQLLELSPSSPLRENLEQVLHASLRAKELIGQILTVSRFAQEQQRIPTDISLIIKEALKLLRSTLPTSIEMRQKIRKGIALADPTQIHQVLMNLCTNAAYAMDGKGILEVHLSPVDLSKSDLTGQSIFDLKPGPYLGLTVSDTGCGMDAETMERIFDPYFTTKEVGKGSGLGLAVVSGIVKRHEGAITVLSKPGKGTEFSIYIPRVDVQPEATMQGEDPLPRGSERILFVDDEPAVMAMATRLLEHLGYKVTSQTNSVNALEVFLSSPDEFDLVITDYTMPKLTGIDLAREVRRIRPDMRIVLCTGFSEKITPDGVKELGMELLMKPYSVREISEVVRKILEARGELI